MEETQGGVVAIAGIRCGDQKYANVAGTAAAQQPYHELHGGAGHEDPKNLE